jgi:hypothetical protein
LKANRRAHSSNPAGGLTQPRRKQFAQNALFLRTAAPLVAAFPGSPSRNAARVFCFIAIVFLAFLPNASENDDRAVVDRDRPHARAASRWFENNKVTHWLFSG